MSEMAPDASQPLSLPSSIVSPTDIARLTREIEALDSYFQEQQIRQGGTPNGAPRVSKLMDQLVSDNRINLLVAADRQNLRQVLESLHRSAPVMHISFSVDPPGSYVQKIIEWLRSNIHRHILVTVGLQPNIGAGCIVRTTNKLFDFSLREFFAQKRPFFIEKLHQAVMATDDTQATNVESIVAAPQPQEPIHVGATYTPPAVTQAHEVAA
jgi:F0F1-type ATP synthase delta subunit